MGWTTCFSAKHYKWVNGRQVVDRKACCDDLCTWDSKGKDGNVLKTNRVLKSAMVGSVWYAAIETVCLATGERKVWAGEFLTCGRSRHDGTIWGYKDMGEDEGPYPRKCPVGILDLLTPTTSEWANKWRQDCRDNAARKSRERSSATRLKIPDGITCRYRGGWIVSSPEYCHSHPYSGVRYHRRVSKLDAIGNFISRYGSEAQRASWAAIGAAAA